MNLEQTQALFWKMARREASEEEINSCVKSSPRLSAKGCAEVYAGAFFVRQRQGLAGMLPKTEKLLGESFTEVAQHYIIEVPGRHAALELLAREFPAFLAQLPGREQAASLARLELARNDALISPADPTPPLDAENLGRLGAGASLVLSRSSQLLETDVETLRLFDPSQVESLDAASPSTGSLPQRCQLLFYRKRFAVYHRLLEEDEARAFALLAGGATVAEFCEVLIHSENPAQRAHKLLSWLLRQQLVLPFPSKPA